MGKKLWAFAVDFWRDGSALLGFIAAPLSITFTLAKAFDVEALGHLREISYAWALAPITLWIFVAYVRLHARTLLDSRKEMLRSFYVSAGPIITRQLPKTISESDFENYMNEANLWLVTCADWIGKNMGAAACARFLDRTGIEAASYQGAVNERHNSAMSNLTRHRQNLLAMIEGNAWDR